MHSFRCKMKVWIFCFCFLFVSSGNSCVLNDTDAISALSRARTDACRNEIKEISCKLQNNALFDYWHTSERFCPAAELAGKYYGCVELSQQEKFMNTKNLTSVHVGILDVEACVAVCVTYGYGHFNFDDGKCICVGKMKSEVQVLVQKSCTGAKPLVLKSTGVKERRSVNEQYSKRRFNVDAKIPVNSVRIVFLFTITGRSLRQVYRIFKLLYHKHHYYYFHVDSRMQYLRRELEKLEAKFPSNVHVSRSPLSTIWGGAKLLDMHLAVMKHLLEVSSEWKWDFVLNLSETDFPIKTIFELTEYLNENRKFNFLKFRSNSIHTFIHRQGLNKTFLQCENHMWRIGTRELLYGLQFDGGSDWFCLNRHFVSYVVNTNDEFVERLKEFYKYTLLPSEAFFHTVILNSRFCDLFKDSNLRHVNWKRTRGCNCNYKSVVDWCGCSPNVYNLDDLKLLESLEKKPLFLARKFDPLINQQIINKVDQSIYGVYSAEFASLNSYWHNEFDYQDEDTLDNRYELLYKNLIKSAVKNLAKYFILVENDHQNGFGSLIGRENEMFEHLKSVHSFFEADIFKGFVLTISSPIGVTLEVYFKSAINEKTTVNDADGKPVKFSTSNKDLFLNTLMQLKIGTNYDSKEYLLRNYASVMGEGCNPTLLLQIDQLNEPLNLRVHWLDPGNSLEREAKIHLDESESEHLVAHTLFKQGTNHSLTPGVWTVKVNSFSVETNETKSTVFSKFLVLPTKIDQNHINQTALQVLIDAFWSFEGFCLTDFKSSRFTPHAEDVIQTCSKSYWSSFYNDPKSDISEISENHSDTLELINFKYRFFLK